ncbi:MAG: 30S ribosomal protein S5 [Candidatus Aenigmarchaeota archaeon]|nr:30S ribosomal protein S5 [Candidatus Aenigmarchaeota archaeon]
MVETKVEEELAKWTPKTNLGKAVLRGEVTDINQILDKGGKIKEPQIIDKLIPNLESELVFIGGRPGKGGGIERTPLRITAKMHRSGRRYTTTAFAIVGNKDGIVGIGKGSGKESVDTIEKAIKKAKLSIIKVPRGCGSWECGCGEPHSIPFKTTGKEGSVKITLLPAPKGIGLAVNDESKKILSLAGIKDVWGQSIGDTATRMNLVKATFNALKNLHSIRLLNNM